MTRTEVSNFIEEIKGLKPHEVSDYLDNLRRILGPRDFEAIEKAMLTASHYV